MIQIIGEMHKTRDGKSFFIDYAEFIPEAGAYDLVLFGLRRDEQDFLDDGGVPRGIDERVGRA